MLCHVETCPVITHNETSRDSVFRSLHSSINIRNNSNCTGTSVGMRMRSATNIHVSLHLLAVSASWLATKGHHTYILTVFFYVLYDNCCRAAGSSVSHSGGLGFGSQLGDVLSWLKVFLIFLSYCSQIPVVSQISRKFVWTLCIWTRWLRRYLWSCSEHKTMFDTHAVSWKCLYRVS